MRMATICCSTFLENIQFFSFSVYPSSDLPAICFFASGTDSCLVCLDRRMSALSENFVKRGGRDDSLTRSVSGVTEMRSFKSQSLVSDKRSSWYEREETIPNLDSFRPVTITVSSFFKQVSCDNFLFV